MSDFDVYYFDSDGSSNHCILEANLMSEVINYVESVKGGFPYLVSVKNEDKDKMRRQVISGTL